jgi:hypothetical protein
MLIFISALLLKGGGMGGRGDGQNVFFYEEKILLLWDCVE